VSGDPYAIVQAPLSGRPWVAEVEVSATLATALIESQCPALAPAHVALMGEGWDNTAYLVNGEWVFRFPRRTIAAPLLESEGRVLPALAPRLPYPIPVPVWFGRPDATYKWPFIGYRRLEGHVASDVDLDEAAQSSLAAPTARFLRALHDVPVAEAQAWGAPPDAFGRLDGARLDRLARPALADLVARGTIDDAAPWLEVVDAGLAALPLDGPLAVVHGDFYSRHILVDDAGRMTGVIDFGDLHVGHPAVDISVAWTVLPPRARREFFAIYGEVGARVTAVARLRALTSALAQEAYGRDVGDTRIQREGVLALRRVVQLAVS
jgi:aminoglycoside phosphotransferase (APT) family kinase protein